MRPCIAQVGFVVVLAIVSLVSAEASALPDCPPDPEPGVESVLPADGAQLVTRDAWIRLRYTPSYFEPGMPPGESIVLRDAGGNLVPGAVQVVDDRDLFFVPSEPLAASLRYEGSTTGAVPFTFSFTTGPSTDLRSPTLAAPGGDPEFQVTSAAVESSCDAPDGGRRIGVTFTSAADDGPSASLEYYLYLSRGPAVEAPVLVATTRSYGAQTTMAFVLPPQQLDGQVCIQLTVADGVGKTDRWDAPYCFDPLTGTAFYGLCSASPAAPDSPGRWLWALVPAALLVRRSRRRTGID